MRKLILMLKFAKPRRIRDRRHLDWLRELPCLRCLKDHPSPSIVINFSLDTEPAHIRLKSQSGTAIKPSDDLAIPLCYQHHHIQHQRGERTFWGDNLDKAISLAKSLYEVSGNRKAAIALIKEAAL